MRYTLSDYSIDNVRSSVLRCGGCYWVTLYLICQPWNWQIKVDREEIFLCLCDSFIGKVSSDICICTVSSVNPCINAWEENTTKLASTILVTVWSSCTFYINISFFCYSIIRFIIHCLLFKVFKSSRCDWNHLYHDNS